MNTKHIITILLLILSQSAFSQKMPIPYERLDSLSKVISRIQLKVNNKTIKIDRIPIILKVNEGSFTIYSQNQKATLGYYYDDKLHLYDNIDLALVEELYQSEDRVTMIFPFRSCSYTIYKDGDEFKNSTHIIDVFYDNEKDGKTLLSALYHLINILKIDKGLEKKETVKKEWADWQKSSIRQFYKTHPKSILSWHGRFEEFGNYYYKQGEHDDALFWFKKLIRLKDAESNKYAAEIYYKKLDYKKAMSYYKKAADKKNIYSIYAVGYMYNNGEGVEPDYNTAVEWLQKAVDEGFSEGIPELEKAKKNAKKNRRK